jgi:alpha-glucoside transport system permease protein
MRLARRHEAAIPVRIGRLLERGPLHLLILLIAFLWLVPTLALLVSSFRPANLVLTTGWWHAFSSPLDFTLDNYKHVLNTNNMSRSFVNSLFVSIPATVMPIMIAAYAAYAFAWMDFPGRDWIFLVVVGLLVVPLQMTLIPVLQLFTDLHITGTFPAIWLAHTGYGLPLTVFLLRNFFGGLPREMMESAAMDGAGPLTVFFRLVLPTSVPALASVAIFQFLWVWNDLLVALVYLGGSPDVAPMPVTISNLVNSLGQGWQFLTAAAFISMMLPLVVFFSLQRYFVSGLLAGSVKG